MGPGTPVEAFGRRMSHHTDVPQAQPASLLEHVLHQQAADTTALGLVGDEGQIQLCGIHKEAVEPEDSVGWIDGGEHLVVGDVAPADPVALNDGGVAPLIRAGAMDQRRQVLSSAAVARLIGTVLTSAV